MGSECSVRHRTNVGLDPSHSCKLGVSTAYNAPASGPRLVTSEVYAMVAVPAECRDCEFVLSLIRSNDLIANSAALSFTVTCPHFRGEAGGQLPRAIPVLTRYRAYLCATPYGVSSDTSG